ncbi:hypothetical protein F2P81_020331 [Scophthalmus maximus]|uniref:Uncharacterized protein n=1 Tax=Scophthalmus maximus TaxID=52904 RepID=A0A6A4S7Q5_SCOMX|nr:hypothetical protein F2P81_020331 [Scophthalmus maximus]
MRTLRTVNACLLSPPPTYAVPVNELDVLLCSFTAPHEYIRHPHPIAVEKSAILVLCSRRSSIFAKTFASVIYTAGSSFDANTGSVAFLTKHDHGNISYFVIVVQGQLAHSPVSVNFAASAHVIQLLFVLPGAHVLTSLSSTGVEEVL